MEDVENYQRLIGWKIQSGNKCKVVIDSFKSAPIASSNFLSIPFGIFTLIITCIYFFCSRDQYIPSVFNYAERKVIRCQSPTLAVFTYLMMSKRQAGDIFWSQGSQIISRPSVITHVVNNIRVGCPQEPIWGHSCVSVVAQNDQVEAMFSHGL